LDPVERVFNVALAASFLGWAAMGLREDINAVRLSIAVLNAVIAILLLRRSPELQDGTWRQHLAALPSLLVAGLVFSRAPESWGIGPQVLFVLGTLQAIWAFVFLGRSFAVLPAKRDLVIRGPYRWIRHPAYVGELVMVAACAWATGLGGLWAPVVLLPLLVLRIRAEEQLLGELPEWGAFVKRVRWRLLPGIW
jgi:protein-S-isoprenylcysteine O-methyltransferase Ste14